MGWGDLAGEVLVAVFKCALPCFFPLGKVKEKKRKLRLAK